MALTPMAEDGVWIKRGPALRAEVKKNPALYGRENPVDEPVYVVGEDAIKRVLSQGWMLIDDPRVDPDARVSPKPAPDPEPVDPELEAAAEKAHYQALRDTGAQAEADMRQHTPAAPQARQKR